MTILTIMALLLTVHTFGEGMHASCIFLFFYFVCTGTIRARRRDESVLYRVW